MRRMHQIRAGIMVVAGCVFMAGPAFAQDPIHKAGRGLTNVLTCWLEIPKGFHLGMQEENPVMGAGVGLLKGGWLAATRLLVGAYEAVSFPLPYPNEYASPYEGLELPDYAWE